MARKSKRKPRQKNRRRRRYSSSEESTESSSSESESESSSESSSDSSSESSKSSSSSDSSDSSDSSSEDSSGDDIDLDAIDSNPKKSRKEIGDIIRDAKLMKYESQIINAGIDNYAALRDVNLKRLKSIGLETSDAERLLKAFQDRLDQLVEEHKQKKDYGRGKRSSSKKSKGSRGSSKSKKSKKKKSSRSRSPKVDPDEALRKLDTGWSGKKQAWADYKEHEARVAELMEFYDEIGKKRTNGEEHARKLLCSYPGGINKLVIALDKKYNRVPDGWEELLEEAYRKEELEEDGSNSD